MSVCLLLIDDGREDYLQRAQLTLDELAPKPDFTVTVLDLDHSLGFAGAIAQGWASVLETGADYVLHWESDFIARAPVELAEMIGLLERHPRLAQVSLKRQAWNERERAAGGIVEADSDDFTEMHDGVTWTEHRRYFTTNPSVYSTSLCSMGWPQVEHSEGVFTHRLLEDPELRFAIWGGKFDPPAVEHIGEVRAGVGY